MLDDEKLNEASETHCSIANVFVSIISSPDNPSGRNRFFLRLSTEVDFIYSLSSYLHQKISLKSTVPFNGRTHFE